MSTSPPMDWRPSDGLEVEDDEDLDGLRQKPSNGLEESLGVGRPWMFGTWWCGKTTTCKPSDGQKYST